MSGTCEGLREGGEAGEASAAWKSGGESRVREAKKEEEQKREVERSKERRRRGEDED